MLGPYLIGQTLTLVTVLRRIMLAEIEGLAIICLHVPELYHEFSSIPNVQEDTLEVVLNLTSVVLAGQKPTRPFTATLYTNGPTVVTARDILLPQGISIANPYHYITTINDHSILEIELLIGLGKGTILSEELTVMLPLEWNSCEYIVVDAAFAPVIKINFFLGRAGKKTFEGWETLMIEIWTNGSLSLSYAFNSATQLLKSTFLNLQNVVVK